MRTSRRSLLWRFLGALFLSLLLVTGAGTALAYLRTSRTLEQEVRDQLSHFSRTKAGEFHQMVVERQTVLLTLAETQRVRYWGEIVSTKNESHPAFVESETSLRDLLSVTVRRDPALRSLALIRSPYGRVVLATDPELEGRYVGAAPYFQQGMETAYVGPAEVSLETGRTSMSLALPFADVNDRVIGVLVANLDVDWMLRTMLKRENLAPQWQRFVVDSAFLLVTGPGAGVGRPQLWPEAAELLREGREGSGIYHGMLGNRVVGGYAWFGDSGLALLLETDYGQAVTRPATRVALPVMLLGGMLSLGILLGAGLSMNHVLQPVRKVVDAMDEVASGRLDIVVQEEGQGEIAALTQGFVRLVEHLRHFAADLRDTVVQQRSDLEQRSRQLQAAARVSQLILGIRDLSRLFDEIARLVSESFQFEHVGIFLVDNRREYAVLRAASSEGGQRMLARHHRLRLGQGIVGSVAEMGKPRIALDVGEDPVFFDNPDLPRTRSEVALPLLSRDHVIGVLDVQSEHAGAFTEEDVMVLQSMADQVALAIENASLLAETQQVLAELQMRYGQEMSRGWQRRYGERLPIYAYDGIEVAPLGPDDIDGGVHREPVIREVEGGGRELVVPIAVRQQVLGTLILRQDQHDDPWEREDLEMAVEVCSQVGRALETARLLDEAQARAQFEGLAGDISEQIRAAAVDVDAVLRTTLRELATALRARGRIQIRPATEWSVERSNGD